MTSLDLLSAVLIGCGATLLADLWAQLLQRFGIPGLNLAMLGRWVGHFYYGQFFHVALNQARPISHEVRLGYLMHYLTGVLLAVLLLLGCGADWLRQALLLPALALGLCSVVLPYFVMQPAMGLGIAASKTATPLKNCLKSLIYHLVFGLGLYLSASIMQRLLRVE